MTAPPTEADLAAWRAKLEALRGAIAHNVVGQTDVCLLYTSPSPRDS